MWVTPLCLMVTWIWLRKWSTIEPLGSKSISIPYITSLLSYWVTLEEMVAFNNEHDLDAYFDLLPQFQTERPETKHIMFDERAGVITLYRKETPSYFRRLQTLIKPNMLDYKTRFDHKLEEIKFLYSNLGLKSETQERYQLILKVAQTFEFIAILSCGMDPSQSSRLTSKVEYQSEMYPLVNITGWHSYNSFLYALINGISSGPSLADEKGYCPHLFMRHDLGHRFFMKDIDLNLVRRSFLIQRPKRSGPLYFVVFHP